MTPRMSTWLAQPTNHMVKVKQRSKGVGVPAQHAAYAINCLDQERREFSSYIQVMAKAKFVTTFHKNIPKLVFRDHGEAKTVTPRSGARKSAQNETESTLSHPNKSQSFKTVFLGDANVGKTCLAKLFVERRVLDQTTNTIGFDHHVKEMEMEGGVKVKLQVWDTAGMEQFRNALVTKYYRNTDGIVFVFDLTKEESLTNLEGWVKEAEKYIGGLDSVQMVLLGNKQDKEFMRKVSFEDAKAFANRYGMLSYQEVSAKNIDTAQILDDLFTILAEEMVRNRETLEMTQSTSIHTRNEIISLSDEWEVLEIPEEEIPHSVFSPQEASIRLRQRQKSSKCAC